MGSAFPWGKGLKAITGNLEQDFEERPFSRNLPLGIRQEQTLYSIPRWFYEHHYFKGETHPYHIYRKDGKPIHHFSNPIYIDIKLEELLK